MSTTETIDKKAAAKLLGVSTRTVQRRVDSGEYQANEKPSHLKRRHRLIFDRAYILALAQQAR